MADKAEASPRLNYMKKPLRRRVYLGWNGRTKQNSFGTFDDRVDVFWFGVEITFEKLEKRRNNGPPNNFGVKRKSVSMITKCTKTIS